MAGDDNNDSVALERAKKESEGTHASVFGAAAVSRSLSLARSSLRSESRARVLVLTAFSWMPGEEEREKNIKPVA